MTHTVRELKRVVVRQLPGLQTHHNKLGGGG